MSTVISLFDRRPAPLIRTRLSELSADATVLPFTAPCPTWCTAIGDHDRHLAATGLIAARLPGRFDLVTVMVQQDRGRVAVDLRVQPTDGQPGALLDVDALDELIGALSEARRCLGGATDPRPVRYARAGWASNVRPGLPPVRPGRAHSPTEAS